MQEDQSNFEKQTALNYEQVIAQLATLQPYKAPEQVHVERLGAAIRAAHRRGVSADALSAMLKKQGINLSAAYLRKNVLGTNGKKTQRQKKKSGEPPQPIRKAVPATNDVQGIAVAAKEDP
jgi:Zn-dependent peptidase ImmA (M78 family)